MKLRRRIIRLHVALEAARRHRETKDAAFWADPMTAQCSCAGEIATHLHRRFAARQRDRFYRAFRPLGRHDTWTLFESAERMCGRTVRNSLTSAWMGEG